MKNINSVNVSGNLVRDAEMRGSVLSFSVACNEPRKVGDAWEEYVNYIDCAIFGKRAEALKDKLKKGCKVFVNGTMHQSRYEDKEGKKRSSVSINVKEIEFLSSNKQVPDGYDYIPFD